MLLELCRFRNAHPAFDGTFVLYDTMDSAKSVLDVGDSAAAPGEDDIEQGLLTDLGVSANQPDRRGVWCGASSRSG